MVRLNTISLYLSLSLYSITGLILFLMGLAVLSMKKEEGSALWFSSALILQGTLLLLGPFMVVGAGGINTFLVSRVFLTFTPFFFSGFALKLLYGDFRGWRRVFIGVNLFLAIFVCGLVFYMHPPRSDINETFHQDLEPLMVFLGTTYAAFFTLVPAVFLQNAARRIKKIEKTRLYMTVYGFIITVSLYAVGFGLNAASRCDNPFTHPFHPVILVGMLLSSYISYYGFVFYGREEKIGTRPAKKEHIAEEK